jgi:hypothetical protein
MILKRIHVGAYDPSGESRVLGLLKPGKEIFEKFADADVELMPDMKDFWNTQSQKLHTDRLVYLLVNILGAGEYWGSNLNGDFFPEQALITYHKTFMHAYPFVHHQNSSPEKDAIGTRCLFASYNARPHAHRVEVIVALDKQDPRAQEMALNKIEKGLMPSVSMGTRVPYDICNICGHRSFTRYDYCDHLKHHMNGIWEGRTRVVAINDHPSFFDISFVDIPADPSSGTLAKLAHQGSVISSAELAEQEGLTYPVKTAKKVEASIEKTGPEGKCSVGLDPNQAELITEKLTNQPKLNDLGLAISEADEPLDEDLLDTLSRYDLEDVLGTAGACRMAIKPAEVTYIVIRKTAGLRPARSAYRDGLVLAKTAMPIQARTWLPAHFNPEIAAILVKRASRRSLYPRWVGTDRPRCNAPALYKSAQATIDAGDMSKVASIYDSYRASFAREDPRILFYLMQKNASLSRLAGYIPTGNPGRDFESMGPSLLVSMSYLRGAYQA